VKRRLFNLLAAVSLIFSLGFAMLWARSYARMDGVGYSHNAPPGLTAVDWGYHLTSECGVLTLGYYIDHYTSSAVVALQHRKPGQSNWNWVTLSRNIRPPERTMGFNSRRNTYTYGTNRNWQLFVPHAALCVLTLVLPAFAFVSHRRQTRRSLAGTCLACGYDLRATPDRCPECGTVPANMKAAT
jgi:hypothetical protein